MENNHCILRFTHLHVRAYWSYLALSSGARRFSFTQSVSPFFNNMGPTQLIFLVSSLPKFSVQVGLLNHTQLLSLVSSLSEFSVQVGLLNHTQLLRIDDHTTYRARSLPVGGKLPKHGVEGRPGAVRTLTPIVLQHVTSGNDTIG